MFQEQALEGGGSVTNTSVQQHHQPSTQLFPKARGPRTVMEIQWERERAGTQHPMQSLPIATSLNIAEWVLGLPLPSGQLDTWGRFPPPPHLLPIRSPWMPHSSLRLQMCFRCYRGNVTTSTWPSQWKEGMTKSLHPSGCTDNTTARAPRCTGRKMKVKCL